MTGINSRELRDKRRAESAGQGGGRPNGSHYLDAIKRRRVRFVEWWGVSGHRSPGEQPGTEDREQKGIGRAKDKNRDSTKLARGFVASESIKGGAQLFMPIRSKGLLSLPAESVLITAA